MDIPAGMLHHAGQPEGLGQLPHPRPGRAITAACRSRSPTTPTPPPTASFGSARAATSRAWCCSPWARASAAASSSATWSSAASTATAASAGHIDHRSAPTTPGCAAAGRRGHLEAYASATAVIKRTQRGAGRRAAPVRSRERLAAGDGTDAQDWSPRRPRRATSCRWRSFCETARYLGVGVVNLMHTIDPSGVLLGGAMTFGGTRARAGPPLPGADPGRGPQRRSRPVLAEKTVIDFATLGGDAGYIGAAGMARLEHLKLKGRLCFRERPVRAAPLR